MAQAPLVPLALGKLLLHSACTGKDPVARDSAAAPPGSPGEIHAHLSAFSPPDPSSQPELGKGPVTVSAYSCPSTMLTPSSRPLTKLAPQLPPASVMYGRLV